MLYDFIFKAHLVGVWLTEPVYINQSHKYTKWRVPLALMSIFILHTNQKQYQFIPKDSLEAKDSTSHIHPKIQILGTSSTIQTQMIIQPDFTHQPINNI